MLIFLKLGGSLITDKNKPNTAHPQVLKRIGREIASVLAKTSNVQLLIGHGSGSFGHVAGDKYGTRQGVNSPEQWDGFLKVWQAARNLNQIVLDALLGSGLRAISLPASAFLTTTDRSRADWNPQPIQAALNVNLIPLLYGDVIFDSELGGTILSTEEIFKFLALYFKPERILLAGLDQGVWYDYPQCDQLITHIHAQNYPEICSQIRGSVSTDVTGGMAEKVGSMLALTDLLPSTQVRIFSGGETGNIAAALNGEEIGTLITHNP